MLKGAEMNGEGLEGQDVAGNKVIVGAYSATVLCTGSEGIDIENWKYNVTVK